MNFYSLYFDGSCWPNPGGEAAYGFVLSHNGADIISEHGIIGKGPTMTNNVSEHFALWKGLQAFMSHYETDSVKNTHLSVKGDSDLVIKQMNRVWGMRHNKPYIQYAVNNLELLKIIRSKGVIVELSWIPREQNTKCDDLSKYHLTNSS